jgi:uncharacterized membrane protein YkgB
MSLGPTFCKAAVVSDAQPLEVAAVEVQSRGSYRRVGVAVVTMAAVALVGAFIPLGTVAAGVLAVITLVLGVSCLIRDPGFNLPALIGTLLASAAVSAAIIMLFVYA